MFSDMIASTSLAVLFVPTFIVVIQRFENWLLKEKKKKTREPATAPVASRSATDV